MLFNATCRVLDGVAVVSIVGDIDLASAPALRTRLLHAARQKLPVRVDLHECDFIDSVGVGLLIGAARRARTAGLSFQTVGSTRVLRVFQLCQVEDVLGVTRPVPSEQT
jgi:anti-sigma B factor antagonist